MVRIFEYNEHHIRSSMIWYVNKDRDGAAGSVSTSSDYYHSLLRNVLAKSRGELGHCTPLDSHLASLSRRQHAAAMLRLLGP